MLSDCGAESFRWTSKNQSRKRVSAFSCRVDPSRTNPQRRLKTDRKSKWNRFSENFTFDLNARRWFEVRLIVKKTEFLLGFSVRSEEKNFRRESGRHFVFQWIFISFEPTGFQSDVNWAIKIDLSLSSRFFTDRSTKISFSSASRQRFLVSWISFFLFFLLFQSKQRKLRKTHKQHRHSLCFIVKSPSADRFVRIM